MLRSPRLMGRQTISVRRPHTVVLAGMALGLVVAHVTPASAEPTAGGGRAITITVEPADVTPSNLAEDVRLAGAWELRADDPEFGGLSGILIEGDRLTAITDAGVWLTATLTGEGAGLGLNEARMSPMRLPDGRPIEEGGADAEGLARLLDGRLVVSFERDHRVAVHVGAGRLSLLAQPRAFEALQFNAGLEALATLADGAIMAIGEGRVAGRFPMFRIEPDGSVLQNTLSATDRHEMTGADIVADGAVYVVMRHFSRLTGVSIRVRAYAPGSDGLPDPAVPPTELAAFGPFSGIDNMEAIAAVPRADGATDLWIVSDDNFSALQRTLLVRLVRAAAG